MAAPSYTTDLATHTAANSTTGWVEATGFTSTDGSGEVDTDLAIYGTSCISESQRKSGKGSLYYGGTARTLPTNGGFFIWCKFFAPNALQTKAAGGLQVFVGSATGTFRQYYVNGSDTYPYGGWLNYVVDPRVTASATTGTPNTTYSHCGIGTDLSVGISKGNSLTVDIIRYGRGEAIITDGDLGNGYAEFDGLATVNDNATTGRWGLFQDVGGSYLWKGLLSLGTSGTSVDFRDANRVINIANTEFVQAPFNRIEINNASSNVEWEAISISALGTVSKGEFECIDNATVALTTCTFTDMSTFDFLSNTTVTGTIFRRCGLVTLGGASIVGCTFENSPAASSVSTDDLDLLDGCTFVSDGSNHAVDLGTISASDTMGWNCTTTGYAGTNGSTGNETILVSVASGQTLTINVAAGATTPTYYNTGAGTVNVVSGQVTTKIIVKDNTGALLQDARVYITAVNSGPLANGTVIFNDLTNASGEVTDVRSLAANQDITGWVRKSSSSPFFKTSLVSGTIDNGSGVTINVQMIRDE